MPRLSICLNRADPDQNFENENLDICQQCWPSIGMEAFEIQEQVGPRVTVEQVQVDIQNATMSCGAEHPSYDGEGYKCALCGDELTEEDD